MLATPQDTVDNMKSGETFAFPWALWIFNKFSLIKAEQSQAETYLLIGL